MALEDVRADNERGRADLARGRTEARQRLEELRECRETIAASRRSGNGSPLRSRSVLGRRTGVAGAPWPDDGAATSLAAYAESRDQRLRAELLAHYDSLAVSLARRFHTHRELDDDLEQVARIGLIHAADRFDPGLGRPFVVFARATIIGELKRHLRDHTWPMRLPRPLHDCYLMVVGVMDDLTQELGRSPRIAEVATRTGLSEEEVLEAMEVFPPLSLESPYADGQSLEPCQEDQEPPRLEDCALIASLVAPLSPRQQQVIEMRFVEGLTQLEIGRRLGVSQMCISRLLAKSLRQMRERAETQALAE
jgi:RNA polymerase sigma-B factor